VELTALEHDVLADAGYDLLRGVVEAGADEEGVGGGLQVDVIARHARLLAPGADVHAHVPLVGPLVVGETHIAVDAVGDVLQPQVLHARVELLHAVQETQGEVVEPLLHVQVLRLVRIEPRLIVILRQAGQEIEYLFHCICGNNRPFFINPSCKSKKLFPDFKSFRTFVSTKRRDMQAMIFAAGLGTRLQPLTNDRPKALVEVAGRPLLEHVIRKLKRQGFQHLVVNVHHFGEQIIDFLRRNDNFGLDIRVSDERDLLLNTGGGIKRALPLFLLFNREGLLRGWLNERPEGNVGKAMGPEPIDELERLPFTGIHVVTPGIYEALAAYPGEVFSIIDFYLSACMQHPIKQCSLPDGCRWVDCGKVEALERAREILG